MIGQLLTQLLGDARRLASVIVILLAAIYISGFLIVNLYLGQFGVVCLELVQAQFVAAGLLFVFIAGIAGLSALTLLVPVLELLDCAARLWHNPQFERYSTDQSPPAEQPTAGAQNGRPASLKQSVLGWLLKWRRAIGPLRYLTVGAMLVLACAAFFLLFTLFESISSQVTAYLLNWTGGGAPLGTDLIPHLEPLARLEGLSVFFVFTFWLQADRLRRFIQRGAVILTIALFLTIQAYSLIWFSDRLYGELPRSVGGGKPVLVQFFAERDELQTLEELGVPIDPLAIGDTAGKTQVVQLILQKNRDASPATHIILPCRPPQACRAIEFDSSLALGVVYYSSD